MPVVTSITIALGAPTVLGQAGTRAASAAGGAQQRERRRQEGRRDAAGARHSLSLIRCPGARVCGSRSGLSSCSVSSETPVFSAIPDGVSPDLTV